MSTFMVKMQKIKSVMALFALVGLSLLAAKGTVTAQAVTQAYLTDAPLERGMIVRLTDKDTSKVQALAAKDITKMDGVVVAANDSPVTLSTENATKQQVFVATNGQYKVLVSNQGGVIKSGDYVTISAIDGIGMKAGDKESRIIGKALEPFDGKANVSGTATVENAQHNKIPVSIGLIGVDINISHNPLEAKPESLLPGFAYLQQAAGNVANKPVTPVQVYVALLGLLASAAVAGSIIYAGVRTSLTAIGRNPLAKTSIMRNLLQVVITGIIILIIGITGVYLILKL
jgi:hypothetical protein